MLCRWPDVCLMLILNIRKISLAIIGNIEYTDFSLYDTPNQEELQ